MKYLWFKAREIVQSKNWSRKQRKWVKTGQAVSTTSQYSTHEPGGPKKVKSTPSSAFYELPA